MDSGRVWRFLARSLNNISLFLMLIMGGVFTIFMFFSGCFCYDLAFEKFYKYTMGLWAIVIFIHSLIIFYFWHFYSDIPSDEWSEIESYEIVFIVYWTFVSIFIFTESLYVVKRDIMNRHNSNNNNNEIINAETRYMHFEERIFSLFGINESDIIDDFDTNGIVFHYFLMSILPSILAGFITNWFLENRYSLICNNSYDIDSSSNVICFSNDNICCKKEYLNYDFYTFFAIGFANGFALYKIICFITKKGFEYYYYESMDYENSENSQAYGSGNNNNNDNNNENENDDYHNIKESNKNENGRSSLIISKNTKKRKSNSNKNRKMVQNDSINNNDNNNNNNNNGNNGNNNEMDLITIDKKTPTDTNENTATATATGTVPTNMNNNDSQGV